MQAAAKLGDTGAQINVGTYYDEGKGVRRSRSKSDVLVQTRVQKRHGLGGK